MERICFYDVIDWKVFCFKKKNRMRGGGVL